MLAEDLGIHPSGSGPWKIHFAEYIRAAHGMHSPKWKLTNRDLSSGYLTVTEEEIKRILEEAAREKILKGLPVPVDEKICACSAGIPGAAQGAAGAHKGAGQGGPGPGGGGGLSSLH